MFDHVTIRAADRDASRRFYDTVLGSLGHGRRDVAAELDGWGDFRVAPAYGAPTGGLHVGFVAASREEVDAFWRAGVDAGFRSDGEPGLRPVYHDDYYGGFLLDPDGNSVEAVFHGSARDPGGVIDHLWLRVVDLEAAKGFWDAVAPALGLGVRRSDRAERVHVEAGDRSFALLAGSPPTTQVQMAFPVSGDAELREFGRAALAAGGRNYRLDHGVAFVRDPDGNDIVAVSRDRG